MSGTENIADNWLLKHYKKNEDELIKVLEEYGIQYQKSNFLHDAYQITYKEKSYEYVINEGRWQLVGRKKHDLDNWYHSKNPRQFVEDYLINSPYS